MAAAAEFRRKNTHLPHFSVFSRVDISALEVQKVKRSAAAFQRGIFKASAIVTMAPEFRRKNIRLPADRYRGRNQYFVTLCFHDRQRLGADPRIATWLIDSLRKNAAACAFFIHAYCVMPDHVHFLADGAGDESNLIKFVESFKQETAFDFARRAHRRLWQFKYYDHILRASDASDRVACYIWLNPVRQGLCRAPTGYPFLGSFTEAGAKLLENRATPEWLPPWKKSTAAALKVRGATLGS
jgi:REP element-mobilizing transposase RayT